ncbi:MAG TPA: hypothetical protein VD886_21295 [Herpetosiphonaceae bacterium]|nr:hypothetical protein [Herpetosiphonaceae bacterium]
MAETYVIRLFFEWGGGSLWPVNPAAYARFDVGPLEECLPLSPASLERLDELSAWHDTALNWDYPPDPGPWRQAECDRFNAAADALLAAIRAELAPDYAVIDDQPRLAEDPDLDAYLADPGGFRRGRQA